MKYIVEESLQDFKAWSGGKDTLDNLIRYGKIGQAEEYIEEITSGREELLTRTEINDILWFESDAIYKYCGIYDDVYNTDDIDYNDEEEEEA